MADELDLAGADEGISHRDHEDLQYLGTARQGYGACDYSPFRSPHHTTSTVAMVGGDSIPRPGEVTLSHHGVLFLDELPEFGKSTLEVLRQPLEDGAVTVARVNATLTFSSRMILVCVMNDVTSILIQCDEVEKVARYLFCC